MSEYSSSPIVESSSFMTGFTVGLFAGAAGYYLFATEKGKKLRRQLSQEWELAKDQLVADGAIVNPQTNLREFLHELFEKAFTFSEGAKNGKAERMGSVEDGSVAGRKKGRETAKVATAKKESGSSSASSSTAGKRFKGV